MRSSLLVILTVVAVLAGCEPPPCNEQNLDASFALVPVEGCCEPGTRMLDNPQQGGEFSCQCPQTGDNGPLGNPVCNAAGNGYECADCPDPYVDGNACENDDEVLCQVYSKGEAESLGFDAIPVMHCDAGTWREVSACEAELCNNNTPAPCGFAPEGADCASSGFGDLACNFDESAVLICQSNTWMTSETCDAPQVCGSMDGTLACVDP